MNALNLEIQLDSAEDTQRLGFNLVRCMNGRALVALIGPLGAGKTTFAKGAGDGLGVEEVVSSPTFTTINEYTTGALPFYHLDLYRLSENSNAISSDNPQMQMREIEIEELLEANGLVLVEWADYMSGFMARQDHLRVELNYSTLVEDENKAHAQTGKEARLARISASGDLSAGIVEALRKIYFS